jgi:G:T-mismatch repair DNA endonuclease (very short patch repair protein)
LAAAGWGVLTVWECELREPAKLKRRLIRELESAG